MARTQIKQYVFLPAGPGAGIVIVPNYLSLSDLLLIQNITSGVTIFNFSDPLTSATKSFKKQKIQLSCGLKNLTNLKNVNASFASGPHNSMSNSAMMGMGRSIFVSLRFNFNRQNS
jgi:hypothetical protein